MGDEYFPIQPKASYTLTCMLPETYQAMQDEIAQLKQRVTELEQELANTNYDFAVAEGRTIPKPDGYT
jgi:cell division protein FtsB